MLRNPARLLALLSAATLGACAEPSLAPEELGMQTHQLTVDAGGTTCPAAALPLGNTVAQWNQIAEDMIIGSGTFQGEGFVYMSYTSAAVYDAVVAIKRGFKPYGPRITAHRGA